MNVMALNVKLYYLCLQSGLKSEVCEIDHKLHAIIAGRRRCVIQSIQEETGTSIYFPSPLQGLVGPEVGPKDNQNPSSLGTSPGSLQSNNLIWITGEFFGVQRARDMLFNLSLAKVRIISPFLLYVLNTNRNSCSEQTGYVPGHCYFTSQAGLDVNRSHGRSEDHNER